jgi:hypothetical protein
MAVGLARTHGVGMRRGKAGEYPAMAVGLARTHGWGCGEARRANTPHLSAEGVHRCDRPCICPRPPCWCRVPGMGTTYQKLKRPAREGGGRGAVEASIGLLELKQ